ncbi:class B sortase [bacterium 1xD8-48]|nr:class B sortase [Lachnospiraceae bacterium]NBJ99384.1 class B sortase [bacterium 1xD8-48]
MPLHFVRRRRYGKMKDLTGKLGKLIFPDVEEKKGRRIVIQIVTGLSIALLSIAGMLFYSHQEVKQQQRFRQIKGAGITLPEIPVMPMGAAREESQEGENGNGVEDMGEIDKNAITFTYDWDSLLEANEDVKGWLYLPDTPIDLPVVGTSDNDYYLTHDFWKQKKSTGCPFMDKDTGQWDFNRTVYAHNMGGASDTMFSPLLRFKDEDYFMAHRQLYYTQCYGITAEYQIMAAVKYNAKDTGSWDFRTRNHADMEGYNLWMEQLQEYALYYAEPDHAPAEILTLSTCDRSEFGKDGRLVIVAGKCQR